ncbi:MAG: ATP-binding protein [Tropicimonas sp.]|uniref:ATP-binding protein n=1 Tax=Tropicimonas sp. TaxID=2067044 RepID=UPI003A8935E2
MKLDTIPIPTEELFFLDAGIARMFAVEALLISRARAKISVYDACAHDLLSARKPPSLTTAIKQLIDAETVERRVRSIQYQMRVAKFPHHKDFATFDYGAAAVTQTQIEPFCSGQFIEEAHNLILVGGTGTGTGKPISPLLWAPP